MARCFGHRREARCIAAHRRPRPDYQAQRRVQNVNCSRCIHVYSKRACCRARQPSCRARPTFAQACLQKAARNRQKTRCLHKTKAVALQTLHSNKQYAPPCGRAHPSHETTNRGFAPCRLRSSAAKARASLPLRGQRLGSLLRRVIHPHRPCGQHGDASVEWMTVGENALRKRFAPPEHHRGPPPRPLRHHGSSRCSYQQTRAVQLNS